MRESQRTSPMNFQFTMVQARAASADGLSSRCGLVRESDGNSPFGKLARFPAVLRGGIVSATPISTHTYLESSVHLLWQKPTWPGAVTRRQPFPRQCRPSRNSFFPKTAACASRAIKPMSLCFILFYIFTGFVRMYISTFRHC